MKQSDVDNLTKSAEAFFSVNNHHLPEKDVIWDVTDFGLGNIYESGLVSVILSNHEEYCEKLMYATEGMSVPVHYHKKKKKDIVCKVGSLYIFFYCNQSMNHCFQHYIKVKKNDKYIDIICDDYVYLIAGERITIDPGIAHCYVAMSDEVIYGEISNCNDDHNDNFFIDDDIKVIRFPDIESD